MPLMKKERRLTLLASGRSYIEMGSSSEYISIPFLARIHFIQTRLLYRITAAFNYRDFGRDFLLSP